MLAGASHDTGLAQKRRRLAWRGRKASSLEEVPDERDEMVIENLQATFGSEASVHRHHHNQQVRVKSP
jgi:hypothetical protein